MVSKNKRARGTGHLYQRGNTWWIQFSANGRPHRESAHTELKSVAQAMLTKRLESVRSKKFRPNEDKVTVTDIFGLVVNEYEANNRPTLPTLKGRWNPEHGAGHDRKKTRTSLKSFFGHIPCTSVDYKMLKTYQQIRQKEGAAAGSINRELNVLKTAWKYALQNNDLTTKPEFPKGLKENVRQGFISDQDYVAFCAACTETGGLWLRTAFEIAFTLGWRKKEIINLRVRNVDLRERTLRLNPKDTKTETGRIAPMTETIFQLVQQCCLGKEQDDYVLTRSNGERVREFRDAWLTVCRKVGKPILFHDLRRSAVSSLIKKGIPRKVAMSISGHETESVFHRYGIIETSDQAEALKIVEQKRAENLLQDPETQLRHRQLPN